MDKETTLQDFGIEGGPLTEKAKRLALEEALQKHQKALEDERNLLLNYVQRSIAVKLNKTRHTCNFRFVCKTVTIRPFYGMPYKHFVRIYPEVIEALKARGFDPANPEEQTLTTEGAP